MKPPDFPTSWQKKMIWSAVTALAVVGIGSIAVGAVWLTSKILGFLQPILIPFAVAGVMAYLLDPVVSRIVRWGTTRHRAVLAVFAVVTVALVGVMFWLLPAISLQTKNLARKVPAYTERARSMLVHTAQTLDEKLSLRMLPPFLSNRSNSDNLDASPSAPGTDQAAPTDDGLTDPDPDGLVDAESPVAVALAPASHDPSDPVYNVQQLQTGEWVQTILPTVLRNSWNFVRSSVGGFLGVFGFLLSMVIVPIYLYYFLIESRNISESWGDYLPLRASAFKDEVVSVLSEINGYLIAFFRGQLIVSLINGTATGIGLGIVRLDFGVLIGVGLCVFGIIPYLGIILCWVPAVIIASVQSGAGTWIPGDPWWVFPLVVTAIFVVVQQVDGLFITPKIVGESVGLHPMTVIVSVFIWSLLMGGLLGAILAVPLTATVKVLLRRYVWERRFRAPLPDVTDETSTILRTTERPNPRVLVER